MVAFLLFLILLVLMFGPSHVFFWGICLIAAAIVVLAVGLGLAALWWVWSWAGSISPGEILAALLVVLRIPITSTAHSNMDFDQCEQPFGWAMIGSVLINGQVAAKWR